MPGFWFYHLLPTRIGACDITSLGPSLLLRKMVFLPHKVVVRAKNDVIFKESRKSQQNSQTVLAPFLPFYEELSLDSTFSRNRALEHQTRIWETWVVIQNLNYLNVFFLCKMRVLISKFILGFSVCDFVISHYTLPGA